MSKRGLPRLVAGPDLIEFWNNLKFYKMKNVLLFVCAGFLLAACSKDAPVPNGTISNEEIVSIEEMQSLTYDLIDRVQKYSGDTDQLATALSRRNFEYVDQELKISAAVQLRWSQLLLSIESQPINEQDSKAAHLRWKSIIESIQNHPEWSTFKPTNRAPVCSQAYYQALQDCPDDKYSYMNCFIDAYCNYCSGPETLVLCAAVTL